MLAEIKNMKAAEASRHIPELSDEALELVIAGDYKQAVIACAKKEKRKRLEIARVKAMYDFEEKIASKPGSVIVGLDEVGRGPLAGPLTVGGVVLDRDELILGINDSKKLSANKRVEIASKIKDAAKVYKTVSVPPAYIDKYGMSSCLRRAFTGVVAEIEKEIEVDIILLDGNPLNFDKREVNVVKGDGKCGSIACASILAKVDRDKYMINISSKYPNYNFDKNKGYGTSDHIDAIKKFGLSPVHRKSFCKNFMQMSFF